MQSPEQSTRRGMRRVGAVLLAVLVGFLVLALWKASVGQGILLWSVEKEHLVVARVLLGLGLDPNGNPEEIPPQGYRI